MNRLRKILRSKRFIAVAAVVVAYTLAGFLLAPYLVRHYVPKGIERQFGKQAAIGKVRIHPYTFTLEANDFRMDEPDGRPIAAFKRLLIDFELKSLFKWAWTFRQVRLEGPAVHAVIDKDGSLNLVDLAPAPETPPPEVREGPPPRMIFEEVVIEQGEISLADGRQIKPAVLTLKPLNLKIDDFTTIVGREGPKSVTAVTADGETLRWTGAIGINPLTLKGNLALEDLHVRTLWQFARDSLQLEPPAGRLTVTTDYHVDFGGEVPQVVLSRLALTLSGLVLTLAGAEETLVELPETRLIDGRFDLAERRIEIGSFVVNGGRAGLAVDEEGTLNLQRIVPGSGSNPSAGAAQDGPEPAGTPWKVMLNDLDLTGIALEYLDKSRPPGLRAGLGELSVRLRAEAEAGGRQTRVRVTDIGVDLDGFRAGFAGEPQPALRIDRVGLQGGAYDLETNVLTAERIAVGGGDVDLRLTADGTLNLAMLFAAPPREAMGEASEAAAAAGHPFQFRVEAVALSGLGAAFSDLSVQEDGPIMHIEDIAVVLHPVDGRNPTSFEANLKVREGGEVKAAGTLNPEVPSLESEIQVTEFGLTVFQPYVSRAASVILNSGTFSTHGTLRHGIEAAGAQTAYKGGFALDDLRLTETAQTETLLGWKSVRTNSLKLQVQPDGLEIGDLSVARPVGRFIIDKDGTLNLAQVLKSATETKEAEPPTSAATTDPFPFRVRRVLVNDGRVDFADLSLILPFGTRIHEMKGHVTGISSKRGARSRIHLDGRVDEYGTADVQGELDPVNPRGFTDLSVVFRNVEMASLSPYSGNFAGRKIDSGKLSLDLQYKIDEGRLDGDHRIVVERLRLGQRVESPQAVRLPLDLAIALLQDSGGVINLGLPVKGDLDSPEFSFGSLIRTALMNVITRIATSPFRALAALIPGGAEEALSKVAFEPGKSTVPPTEKEKLVKLAEALAERPQLRLVVQGRFHPDTDLQELGAASVRLALMQQLGIPVAPGVDPGPVDFGGRDTEKALQKMFEQRFGREALDAVREGVKAEEKARKEAAMHANETRKPEPEDPGRLGKALYMRLVRTETVPETELVGLADARARSVIAVLSEDGNFPLDRVEAKPSAPLKEKDPITAALSLEAAP